MDYEFHKELFHELNLSLVGRILFGVERPFLDGLYGTIDDENVLYVLTDV